MHSRARPFRPLARLAAAGLAGAFGAGCGDDSNEPPAIPQQAAVEVGNIFFESSRNGSEDPAVDTIAVGGTVTWTWTNTGPVPHDVRSTGTPSFTSSGELQGDGATHQATFAAAGTYEYDCGIHGPDMTGRVVVR
jgi:plastocyanin